MVSYFLLSIKEVYRDEKLFSKRFISKYKNKYLERNITF